MPAAVQIALVQRLVRHAGLFQDGQRIDVPTHRHHMADTRGLALAPDNGDEPGLQPAVQNPDAMFIQDLLDVRRGFGLLIRRLGMLMEPRVVRFQLTLQFSVRHIVFPHL